MPAARPKVRSDLAVVEVDGESVVYDETNEQLHHLNGAATIIFSLCDGTSTLARMSSEIATAFGVPRAEVTEQVKELVTELRRSGLLERARTRA